MKKILKYVSFFIIPLCAGLFLKSYFLNHDPIQMAVTQTVSVGISMIPEGLMLLTSIALTTAIPRALWAALMAWAPQGRLALGEMPIDEHTFDLASALLFPTI